MDGNAAATAFYKKLTANPNKVLSYRHGNESGILWEALWEFTGKEFRHKTCASGLFTDWTTHDETAALRIMAKDFEIIHGRI